MLNEKQHKFTLSKKKKKVGRPKKRGPKKKRNRRKIIKEIKKRPGIDFKIISTLNGKQNSYVGSYKTYADAYKKLLELSELNKEVVFPRKFLNKEIILPLKDEYLLLEKNRYGDKTDGFSRNEFGKFVKQQIINNNKWVIRDKIIRLVEETFWVYGYDPKTDRKTCLWIYDNLIINMLYNNYDMARILIYKNKLIIKHDNNQLQIVLCKNKSDAIRLYNFIIDLASQNKEKRIVGIGSYNKVNESRRELEHDIMELTGWNKIKIQRSTN